MVKEGYTSLRVSHRLISFQNNTIDSIRWVLLDLYGFLIIRRTIHIIHISTWTQHVYSLREHQERLPNSTCHRKVRHLSGANHPQWHTVARRPQSNYREPYIQNTYPHHYGPCKPSIPSDCYTFKCTTQSWRSWQPCEMDSSHNCYLLGKVRSMR